MKIIKTDLNFEYPAKSNDKFLQLWNRILSYLESYPFEIDKLVFLIDSGNFFVSIFPGSPGENEQIDVDEMLKVSLGGYDHAFEMEDEAMLRLTGQVEEWFIKKLKSSWKSFKAKNGFGQQFVDKNYGIYVDRGAEFDSFDIRACDLILGRDSRRSPNTADELAEAICKKYRMSPSFFLGVERPVSKLVITRPERSVANGFVGELTKFAKEANIKNIPLWIHRCPSFSDIPKNDLKKLESQFSILFRDDRQMEEYFEVVCENNRKKREAEWE